MTGTPSPPYFLGLGAMRAGSSFLAQLLRQHPRVWMPRREVHYFDRYHDRSLDWYRSVFAPAVRQGITCAGEITPAYLSEADALPRIQAAVPDARFFVVLRDPALRLYSEYTRALRNEALGSSFPEFVEQNPAAVERGLYGSHLRRFVDRFGRDAIHVSYFHDLVGDPDSVLHPLARFLGLDPREFFYGHDTKAANSSYLPRFPRAFASGVRLRRWLHRNNLHAVRDVAVALRLTKVFRAMGPREEMPQMTVADYESASVLYEDDQEMLRAALDRHVPWPPARGLVSA